MFMKGRRRLYRMHAVYHVDSKIVNKDILPIELSIEQFKKSHLFGDALRVTATLQVVNHCTRQKFRGYTKQWCNNRRHDSHLSLFYDETLTPRTVISERAMSEARCYSVRYNYDKKSLIIKGPDIVVDVEYSLTIRHKSIASISRSSTTTETTESINNIRCSNSSKCTFKLKDRSSGLEDAMESAFCYTPGHVQVHIRYRPHPYRKIMVQHRRHQEFYLTDHEIRPCSHILVFKDRRFIVDDEPYSISYSVDESSHSCEEIEIYGTPFEYGQVIFSLKDDDRAGFLDCGNVEMILTDGIRSTNIDPSETDKYSCVIPNSYAHKRPWRRKMKKLMMGAQSFILSPMDTSWIPEWELQGLVPCTIIQCVDRVKKEYRIEPHFESLIALRNEEFEEYIALEQQLTEIKSKTLIVKTFNPVDHSWRSLGLSSNQVTQYWRNRGLYVAEGITIPEMKDEYHKYYSKWCLVHDEFISYLIRRARISLKLLSFELDRLRVWRDAYNDPTLRCIQEGLDIVSVLKHADSRRNLEHTIHQLTSKYRGKLHDFTYPMSVDGRALVMKGRPMQQLKKWETEIERR